MGRSLSTLCLRSLNSAIIVCLLVVGLNYTMAGLSFWPASLAGARSSLLLPVVVLVALFCLKAASDQHWRGFLTYIRSIEGTGCFLLVAAAGLASGLFSYDIENPGRLIRSGSGGPMPDVHLRVLGRYLTFHVLVFTSTWIAYSGIMSGSKRLSFATTLTKDGLIMSLGLLHLLALIRYVAEIDREFVFFLRVTVPALIVGSKALLFRWRDEPAESHYLGAILAASAASFGVFVILSVQKFNTFRTRADFPVYLQALWTSTQGKLLHVNWFIFPDVQGRTYLAHHFEAILLLLIPFYALVRDPRGLMVLHSLVLTAAALLLYMLAKERLRDGYVALCLALSYLLSPLIQHAHLWGFHAYAFEPLLVVLTFYFLQKRLFVRYLVSLALLLLVREFTSLYAALLGLYAVFFLKERKVGLLTILGAIGYFIVATQILLPVLRESDAPYHTLAERYPSLGADFWTVIETVVTKPEVPLSLLSDAWSRRGWGYLLVPLAFLPAMSPQGLLMIVPTTSFMFLSDFIAMKVLGYHYPVSVVPFHVIGAILTLEYLVRREHRWLRFIDRIKEQVGTRGLLAAFGSFILTASVWSNYHFDPLPREYPFKLDYLIGNHRLSPSPTGKHFSPHFYRPNEHDRIGSTFVRETKSVVKDAPLAVELRFAAHFSDRFVLRELGSARLAYSGWKEAEYVFFDIDGDPVESLDDHRSRTLELLETGEFGVVAQRDGYVLLRRGADPSRNGRLITEIMGRLDVEDMALKTGDSAVFDLEAVNKRARFGRAGVHLPGLLAYGHHRDLPKGNYRVVFRAKAAADVSDGVVAVIDVTGEGGRKMLSTRELTGRDFGGGGGYREFVLVFRIDETTEVEPRVFFLSTRDLWVDKITIVPDRIVLD